MNTYFKKIFFYCLLFIVFCFPAKIYAQPALSFLPVITGLSQPMQLVHPGDGTGRIFIVQKAGSIMAYSKTYNLLSTFLTVTGITSTGERGLLSMAFHPGYAVNGLFYVYYTNGNGDLELARYKVSDDPNVADALSKKVMLTIPHPTYQNHNGGELHFGNDGFLYLSTGDGGSGGDPFNNAQNTALLLGKMLRFDVNTSDIFPYYTVPAGNPYGNEIFALGLRNPFRWSFDKLTQDMWIGDVGQDSYEEINYRPYDSSLNVNYGWRCYEGNVVYNNTGTGCGGPLSNYNFPVYSYATPNPGAITGGTVYRGDNYVDFRGYYVATDFYTGTLYLVKYDTITHTATTTLQTPSPTVTGISDFGETEDGEIYAVSLSANAIYRVVASGSLGYTFTGNGDWGTAANWSNNIIPPPVLPSGAEIIIDPVANGECVLNTIQTINAGAKCTVRLNKKFRVNGNLVIQ